MSVVRKNSARTRTFRLNEDVIDELDAEAAKHGFSSNSLMERILEEYLDHGRWVERLNSVTLLPSTLRSIIDELDDETIVKVGGEIGGSAPKEYFIMRGIPLSDKSVSYFITETLGEHNHWFSATYHTGGEPYYFIRMELGAKWSLFVESYLKAFYEEMLNKSIEIRHIGDNLQIQL